MSPEPDRADTSQQDDGELLRSVIERLAVLPRLPTSEGERRAALMICEDLARFGCRVGIEETPAYSSYAWPIGLMCAGSAAASLVAGRGHAVLGAAGAGLALAGIIDDISGWRMAFRRLLLRPRTAYNVVAITGDLAARRTLVVLAHHDAAPSGFVFRQVLEEWLATHRPDIIEAMRTNPPVWWLVLAGPALVSLGSATGIRALRRAGFICSLASLAAMVDIGLRPAVPGANDNLTGVAVLTALARALQAEPVRDLRVMLVSAGAEEALQEGIRGFARHHFAELSTDSTYFLNFDTVGSGRLVLLEGEGPVIMRDYDAGFKDLVAGCAAEQGVPLLRGLRSRNSTDGVVPLNHGYPTATLVSVDDRKLIPHYHLNTDVPANVDLRSVVGATRLAVAVARRLAS